MKRISDDDFEEWLSEWLADEASDPYRYLEPDDNATDLAWHADRDNGPQALAVHEEIVSNMPTPDSQGIPGIDDAVNAYITAAVDTEIEAAERNRTLLSFRRGSRSRRGNRLATWKSENQGSFGLPLSADGQPLYNFTPAQEKRILEAVKHEYRWLTYVDVSGESVLFSSEGDDIELFFDGDAEEFKENILEQVYQEQMGESLTTRSQVILRVLRLCIDVDVLPEQESEEGLEALATHLAGYAWDEDDWHTFFRDMNWDLSDEWVKKTKKQKSLYAYCRELVTYLFWDDGDYSFAETEDFAWVDPVEQFGKGIGRFYLHNGDEPDEVRFHIVAFPKDAFPNDAPEFDMAPGFAVLPFFRSWEEEHAGLLAEMNPVAAPKKNPARRHVVATSRTETPTRRSRR